MQFEKWMSPRQVAGLLLAEKTDGKLFYELWQRRCKQDAKHGGPSHDDTHTPEEWCGFVEEFNARALSARTDAEQFEDYMFDVAALAVAAIQSSRRKRA